MRISDWSSDVCSSDLRRGQAEVDAAVAVIAERAAGVVAPAGAGVVVDVVLDGAGDIGRTVERQAKATAGRRGDFCKGGSGQGEQNRGNSALRAPDFAEARTHLYRSVSPSSRPSERTRARAGIQGQVTERSPWTLGSSPRVTMKRGCTGRCPAVDRKSTRLNSSH